MVIAFASLTTDAVLLAQEAQPLIQRLDPAVRVRVLAALAGLVILGFGLVLLTWLAGRTTRRYMNPPSDSRPGRTVIDEDDWAKKPLNPDQNA